MIYNILGRLSCGPKFWTKNGFEIDFNGVWSTSIDLSTENIFDSIFSIAAIWHLFQGDGWSKAASLTTDTFCRFRFSEGQIDCPKSFTMIHQWFYFGNTLSRIFPLIFYSIELLISCFYFKKLLTVLKKVLVSWHGKAGSIRGRRKAGKRLLFA